MATHASASDVSALRTLYVALIDDMTHTNSTALAIWKQQAENELNLWADAMLAEQNVNAGANSRYSSGVGSNFEKKTAAEILAAAEAHFRNYATLCLRGGVTVPTTGDSVSYWDMSRDPYV